MSFFNTQHREKSSLLISIESGAVTLGIVLAKPGALPALIFETSKTFNGKATGEKLALALLKTLKEGLEEIQKEAVPHIALHHSRKNFDTTVFFYGTPWYFSRGRTVTVEKEAPTIFSPDMIHETLEKYTKDLIPQEIGDTTVIEKYALNFSIDGYKIENPIHKKGKALGMTFFGSAIPTSLKHEVEKTVHSYFPTHDLYHHSAALPLGTALNALYPKITNAVLVHITGYATELTLISDKTVVDTLTFKTGTKDLLHEVSRKGKVLPHEATPLSQNPESGIKNDLLMNASEELKAWHLQLVESLRTLLANRLIPGELIFLGSQAFISPETEVTLTALLKTSFQNVSPTFINPKNLSSWVRTSGSVQSNDPTMPLLAVWESLKEKERVDK